jgi:hypothetical protein
MSIVMRLLGPEDLSVLDHVADGVCDCPVQPQWARVVLADSRHHMIVGVQDGIVVGMVSAADERTGSAAEPFALYSFEMAEPSRATDTPVP